MCRKVAEKVPLAHGERFDDLREGLKRLAPAALGWATSISSDGLRVGIAARNTAQQDHQVIGVVQEDPEIVSVGSAALDRSTEGP